MPIIDLHSHTYFSDGVLGVAELARRAEAAGYRALAITDHVDEANIERVLGDQGPAIKRLDQVMGLRLISGVEITHVRPEAIGALVEKARKLGAELVVVHGESIVEPVLPGTNAAAIEAGCDILAHPGVISVDDVRKAAERGVALEISARSGNALGNGLVARLALENGADMVLNSDAHTPGDLMTEKFAAAVAAGAGIDDETWRKMQQTSARLAGL